MASYSVCHLTGLNIPDSEEFEMFHLCGITLCRGIQVNFVPAHTRANQSAWLGAGPGQPRPDPTG